MSNVLTVGLWVLSAQAQTRPQCEQLLKRYQRLHPSTTWDYDWTTAVFLYGALKFDKTLLDHEKILSELSEQAPAVTMPDLAAMSLPATLSTGPGAQKIKALSGEFFATEPLNALGAINHVGARHRFAWWLPPTAWFVPPSVWADSMIMYVLNGVLLEDNTEFFIEQAKLLEEVLRDNKTGLYKHAYYVESKTAVPEENFWARGNLWMSVGMLEILEKHEDSQLKERFQRHAKVLTTYLQAGGLRTLLDRPSSYYESSATALLVYVLTKGMRLGLLDESFAGSRDIARKALLTFMGPIGAEVSLRGVSGPTTAFKYSWYYTHVVGQESDLSYGVGAALLACSEL